MDASNVTFDPLNMYSNNPEEKKSIITLVISQAPVGSTSATVVYVGRIPHRNQAADKSF